jgi:hypothetical protein
METLPTALILLYISKLQDFLFLFGCREWFATVEGTALSRTMHEAATPGWALSYSYKQDSDNHLLKNRYD